MEIFPQVGVGEIAYRWLQNPSAPPQSKKTGIIISAHFRSFDAIATYNAAQWNMFADGVGLMTPVSLGEIHRNGLGLARLYIDASLISNGLPLSDVVTFAQR